MNTSHILYLNHILAQNGREPINKYTKRLYPKVMDFLQGLEAEDDWKDWVPQGAEPLTQHQTKQIFLASIYNEDRSINLKKLRNKILSTGLIACGWHPNGLILLVGSFC